jgi:hypothetical protein
MPPSQQRNAATSAPAQINVSRLILRRSDLAERIEADDAADVLPEVHAENRDCRQSHTQILLLKLQRAYGAGRRGGPFHKRRLSRASRIAGTSAAIERADPKRTFPCEKKTTG